MPCSIDHIGAGAVQVLANGVCFLSIGAHKFGTLLQNWTQHFTFVAFIAPSIMRGDATTTPLINARH